eukprot:GHUV01033780.1.p1 GENE.GHUV01033780.1~~GHUV01033780.1.p1  ORF type:complete len:298 (+),score=128.68 GHUV01033780.1:530-1423(+)
MHHVCSPSNQQQANGHMMLLSTGPALLLVLLDLPAQVYEMSATAADQQWAQHLLYTDSGAICTRGSEGKLSYHHGGNTVRLVSSKTDSSYQLVATFNGGVVASASCELAKPKQAAPAPAVAAAEAPAPPAEPAEPPAAAATSKKGGSRVVRASGTGARPDSASNRRPGTPSKLAAGQRPGTPGGSAPAAAGTAAAQAAGPDVDKQAGQAVFTVAAAAAEANKKDNVAAAASATAAAVRVCTPGGLLVELSTDGRVLMAPVVTPQAKVCCYKGIFRLLAALSSPVYPHIVALQCYPST